MYMYKDGILFLAVDNLPTEFPREATQWFGDHLLPFLEQIVKSDPKDEYPLFLYLLLFPLLPSLSLYIYYF